MNNGSAGYPRVALEVNQGMVRAAKLPGAGRGLICSPEWSVNRQGSLIAALNAVRSSRRGFFDPEPELFGLALEGPLTTTGHGDTLNVTMQEKPRWTGSREDFDASRVAVWPHMTAQAAALPWLSGSRELTEFHGGRPPQGARWIFIGEDTYGASVVMRVSPQGVVTPVRSEIGWNDADVDDDGRSVFGRLDVDAGRLPTLLEIYLAVEKQLGVEVPPEREASGYRILTKRLAEQDAAAHKAYALWKFAFLSALGSLMALEDADAIAFGGLVPSILRRANTRGEMVQRIARLRPTGSLPPLICAGQDAALIGAMSDSVLQDD